MTFGQARKDTFSRLKNDPRNTTVLKFGRGGEAPEKQPFEDIRDKPQTQDEAPNPVVPQGGEQQEGEELWESKPENAEEIEATEKGGFLNDAEEESYENARWDADMSGGQPPTDPRVERAALAKDAKDRGVRVGDAVAGAKAAIKIKENVAKLPSGTLGSLNTEAAANALPELKGKGGGFDVAKVREAAATLAKEMDSYDPNSYNSQLEMARNMGGSDMGTFQGYVATLGDGVGFEQIPRIVGFLKAAVDSTLKGKDFGNSYNKHRAEAQAMIERNRAKQGHLGTAVSIGGALLGGGLLLNAGRKATVKTVAAYSAADSAARSTGNKDMTAKGSGVAVLKDAALGAVIGGGLAKAGKATVNALRGKKLKAIKEQRASRDGESAIEGVAATTAKVEVETAKRLQDQGVKVATVIKPKDEALAAAMRIGSTQRVVEGRVAQETQVAQTAVKALAERISPGVGALFKSGGLNSKIDDAVSKDIKELTNTISKEKVFNDFLSGGGLDKNFVGVAGKKIRKIKDIFNKLDKAKEGSVVSLSSLVPRGDWMKSEKGTRKFMREVVNVAYIEAGNMKTALGNELESRMYSLVQSMAGKKGDLGAGVSLKDAEHIVESAFKLAKNHGTAMRGVNRKNTANEMNRMLRENMEVSLKGMVSVAEKKAVGLYAGAMEHVSTVRNTLDKGNGAPGSPFQVVANGLLQKGSTYAAKKVLGSMSKENRARTRATLLYQAGVKEGKSNEVFDMATFTKTVSGWDREAIASIFGKKGKEHAMFIKDIALMDSRNSSWRTAPNDAAQFRLASKGESVFTGMANMVMDLASGEVTRAGRRGAGVTRNILATTGLMASSKMATKVMLQSRFVSSRDHLKSVAVAVGKADHIGRGLNAARQHKIVLNRVRIAAELFRTGDLAQQRTASAMLLRDGGKGFDAMMKEASPAEKKANVRMYQDFFAATEPKGFGRSPKRFDLR